MGNFEMIGRWLVIGGVVLVITGGIIWLLAKLTGLNGLPGTIHFEFSGVSCMFPILASIVLSLVLTVVLNVILRLMNK